MLTSWSMSISKINLLFYYIQTSILTFFFTNQDVTTLIYQVFYHVIRYQNSKILF